MITAASLTNLDGGASKSLTVGTAGSVSAGGVTLEELDVIYETERQPLRKHQSSGEWENYAYVRSLILTLRGKIVGTSASSYIDQRQALAAAFLPDEGTQSDRNHTTLALTFSDGSAASDDCIFESFAAPFSVADSDRAAEYTLVLVNTTGFFHSGGSVHKI